MPFWLNVKHTSLTQQVLLSLSVVADGKANNVYGSEHKQESCLVPCNSQISLFVLSTLPARNNHLTIFNSTNRHSLHPQTIQHRICLQLASICLAHAHSDVVWAYIITFLLSGTVNVHAPCYVSLERKNGRHFFKNLRPAL